MPKTKKRLPKPLQTFEFRVVVKTYGSAVQHYSFKEILKRLVRNMSVSPAQFTATRPWTIAKTKGYCAVCMSDIEPKQHEVVLGCKHRFHRRCFQEWSQSRIHGFGAQVSCPMCRSLQDVTYKQDRCFAAVTQYTVEDYDSVVIEREVLPQRQFDARQ